MSSTITRIGNLARTPELHRDENGRPYTFARIIVTDRERNDRGEWEELGTVGYDVAVNGAEAESLVETAAESGNVRIMFSGIYRVRSYTPPKGGETRLIHEVRSASVAVALRGQSVRAERRTASPAAVADPSPLHPNTSWSKQVDPPVHVWDTVEIPTDDSGGES